MRPLVLALLATSLVGCSSGSDDTPPQSNTNPGGPAGAGGAGTPEATEPAPSNGGMDPSALGAASATPPLGTTEARTPDLELAAGGSGGGSPTTEGTGG